MSNQKFRAHDWTHINLHFDPLWEKYRQMRFPTKVVQPKEKVAVKNSREDLLESMKRWRSTVLKLREAAKEKYNVNKAEQETDSMSDTDSSVSERMDTYSNEGSDESGDGGDWNPYGKGG